MPSYFDRLMQPRELPPLMILPPQPKPEEKPIELAAAEPQPSPAQPATVSDDDPYAEWASPAVSSVEPSHTVAAPDAHQMAAPASAALPEAPQSYDGPVVRSAVDGTGNYTIDPAANEKMNLGVAELIQRGATDDEINAFLAPYHADVSMLKNVEANRQYAKDHPEFQVSAVSASRDADPKPVEHGADQGAWDAFGKHVASSVLMHGLDELGGAIGATEKALPNALGVGNGKSWSENYTEIRDENRKALDDGDYYHPDASLAGEVAGGVVSVPLGGGEAALARGGMRAAGELALQGARYGAVEGALNADGGLKDRIEGAGKGALGGAVVGAALGTPLNAVARRIERNVATGGNAGRRVLDAADRLNTNLGRTGEDVIEPLVSQTSHGGVGSHISAALDGTLIGGRLSGLHNAREHVLDTAAGAAEDIANREAGGAAHDITTAAEDATNGNVRGSMRATVTESRQAAQTIYGQAEALAGRAQIPVPQTIRRLDEIIDNWRRNPSLDNDGEIRHFLQLRERLISGENPQATSATWSVQGLRDLRTTFGDQLDSQARYAHEAANKLWGPLSEDINRGLRVSGNSRAAQLYRQADRQWAIREGRVRAIQKIIGKEDDNWSADRIANNLVNASKNNSRELRRALEGVDPAHASAIRGSLLNQLGRAKAGRATEPGEFSLDTFLTNWGEKLSDQAKRDIGFTGQTIRDLDDLATIARGARAAGQLSNHSRTAYAHETLRTLGRVGEIGAGVAEAGGHLGLGLVGSAASVASVFATGNLLARPGVARLLVNLANSRNAGRFMRSVTRLATRDPVVLEAANELVAAGFDDGSNEKPDPISVDQTAATPAATDDDPYAEWAAK